MTPADAQLLAEIKAFLAETGMAPTSFGKQFFGDPSLVADLEGGRSPSGRFAEKVRTKIKEQREKIVRDAAKAQRKRKASAA